MNKFCTHCGKELNEGADICLGCGRAVNSFKTNTDPTAKSKMVAGILALLLGVFGAHNFYLGYNGKATAQLLITLLSCFILSPVSAIWGLIEGIQILTGSMNKDASGKILGE